ncbi:hypothetical protein BEP19_00200 [Ammoniphilus oxalaticus]|uniref:Tellurium resistance protein TerC n=2 Tax=Ammoniphilus oxalaticus TaxID=66863 RepID=A0A419SRK3_9BACL|nr:hypothetical protein BEP19_00200 [Ammoniphilus oxalaticus]
MIIGIDLALAGDNAVVIGMASRNLPAIQRKKAILYGTLAAVVIRVLLTFVAIRLLSIPFLMAIGGLFLIYVAINLIVGDKPPEEGELANPQNMLAAIKTIVVADLIMGLDNILAIAGASRGNFVLILIGLAISIPIIIFASQLISTLMNKYPFLVYVGAGIIAYTAAVMFLGDPFIHQHILVKYHFLIKIVVVILTLLFGKWRNQKQTRALPKAS